jgi:hypothetical protein
MPIFWTVELPTGMQIFLTVEELEGRSKVR